MLTACGLVTVAHWQPWVEAFTEAKLWQQVVVAVLLVWMHGCVPVPLTLLQMVLRARWGPFRHAWAIGVVRGTAARAKEAAVGRQVEGHKRARGPPGPAPT